ncbi:MAG: hypothetical protein V2A34_11505, partial [Lentisphaerota bacterium]
SQMQGFRGLYKTGKGYSSRAVGLLILIVGLLASFSKASDALYIWKVDPFVTGLDGALADLISFCGEQQIDRVFINAAGLRAKNTTIKWECLLRDLHSQGLKVEALLGDPSWVIPGNAFREGMNYVSSVMAYQTEHKDHPAELFDALHFDVEIESCPAREEKKVPWFLAFIDAAAAQRSNFGLTPEAFPFNWDIAMHLDQPGMASAEMTRHNTSKPGWQHILDNLEQITFMAYSDRPRHIAAGLQNELLYLQTLKNPPSITFALEFQSQFRGQSMNSTSLANENHQTYMNLRHYLTAMVITRPSLDFEGFALHHYDHFARDDVRSWFARNPAPEESRIEFAADEDTPKIIPSSMGEPITDPVYIKVNLLAHPCHAPQSEFQKGSLSFLPIGYGYCSESNLFRMGGYDGLMPSDWFFFSGRHDARWWEPVWDDVWSDLNDNGLCWQNPASTKKNRKLGVERYIVLQNTKAYRFLFAYNDVQGIEQFVAKDVVAGKQKGYGDRLDQPVEITMYLGQITNMENAQSPHNNDSLVQISPAPKQMAVAGIWPAKNH